MIKHGLAALKRFLHNTAVPLKMEHLFELNGKHPFERFCFFFSIFSLGCLLAPPYIVYSFFLLFFILLYRYVHRYFLPSYIAAYPLPSFAFLRSCFPFHLEPCPAAVLTRSGLDIYEHYLIADPLQPKLCPANLRCTQSCNLAVLYPCSSPNSSGQFGADSFTLTPAFVYSYLATSPSAHSLGKRDTNLALTA